ncbi:MAG TPA: hypothetical protein VIK37_03035 [Candidatus Saccharimonadales bacterium]
MKHEDKKHFDISKPRRHGPDPTSKPIIVGHHPMMPDPMIREERQKATKPINVASDGETPESVQVRQDEKTPEEPAKPDNLPNLSDISAPHEVSPALTPSAEPIPELVKPQAPTVTPEHAPGAVFPPSSPTPENSAAPAETRMPEAPPSTATMPAARPLQPVVKTPEPPIPPEPPTGQELHIPAGHTAVHHKPRIWVWLLIALIILIWVYVAVDILTDVSLPYEIFKNSASGSTTTHKL